MLFRKI